MEGLQKPTFPIPCVKEWNQAIYISTRIKSPTGRVKFVLLQTNCPIDMLVTVKSWAGTVKSFCVHLSKEVQICSKLTVCDGG